MFLSILMLLMTMIYVIFGWKSLKLGTVNSMSPVVSVGRNETLHTLPCYYAYCKPYLIKIMCQSRHIGGVCSTVLRLLSLGRY